jgi:chorismate synthase
VVIDGCPSGFELSEQDIQPELDRRKPGQSSLTTPRKEEDIVQILSGVFQGKTTGTPILIMAHNRDTRSEDYHHLLETPRPSHADFTYQKKYAHRDWRGSGRASARETLARVAAGAIAQKILRESLGIECVSYVERVGEIQANIDTSTVDRASVDRSLVRCPDTVASAQMVEKISAVQAEGDSIGGVIAGVIRNIPPGLGEPVFDKFHADLGKAMLNINAVKGFEIGSGFAGTCLKGSEHNDPFHKDMLGNVRPKTNRAGGVLGGITTGESITFRVAFKPVATISKPQPTVTYDGEDTILEARGRHDPCVLPRAVPIVDAMAALTVIDHLMRHRARSL